ncbi:10487_t:CDS:2 [Acaulospora colombiana]|uniref:10487_t:CDS:1 n=1 Tax=Acaulospora colombiana TaxID=27376 RepID=A0ACA9MUY0_9GLOM|nr:10487_t:CDS:2 [Acaulospora colombiana]
MGEIISEQQMADKKIQDERIILNIGGVKYETYRSTLTAYPETLLGTMFHERNNLLLRPMNNNEFFFDRDPQVFRYIIQYYRTGKLVFPNDSAISRQELLNEMDFFQIPLTSSQNLHAPPRSSFPTTAQYAKIVDEFVEAIKFSIIETSWNFHETVNITFYATPLHHETLPTDRMMCVSPYIEKIRERLKPYESSGYKILELFAADIKNYLESIVPSYTLNVHSSYHKHYYHPNYTGGNKFSHARSLYIVRTESFKNLKYDILEKTCLRSSEDY